MSIFEKMCHCHPQRVHCPLFLGTVMRLWRPRLKRKLTLWSGLAPEPEPEPAIVVGLVVAVGLVFEFEFEFESGTGTGREEQ